MGEMVKMVELPDLQVLPEVFRKYPDIQAVYLFGSFATGNVHGESDLDLAIVPRGRIYKLGESPKAKRSSNRPLTQASRRWSR